MQTTSWPPQIELERARLITSPIQMRMQMQMMMMMMTQQAYIERPVAVACVAQPSVPHLAKLASWWTTARMSTHQSPGDEFRLEQTDNRERARRNELLAPSGGPKLMGKADGGEHISLA